MRGRDLTRRMLEEADPEIAEKFWSKVQQGPGCWTWTAGKGGDGYGAFYCSGLSRMCRAHRVAFALSNGPVPGSMHVCHTCDNRQCVCPDHLFLGTDADNVRDMHEKGRALKRGLKGAEHHQASLSESDVHEIRRRLALGTERYVDLAGQFGVSLAAIGAIATRRTWAHLDEQLGTPLDSALTQRRRKLRL